ncbi:40S ribosomal protein S13, partial [Tanacetum coccineum]
MARVRLPISKKTPSLSFVEDGSRKNVKSQPHISKKRKITEEEQEGVADSVSNFKVPPELYRYIRKAVVLRDHLKTNSNDMDSILDLESAEGIIRRYAEELKKFNELPHNWKYDPAASKSYDTATYLPLEEEDEDVTKGLDRCCAPFEGMLEWYAKTDDVPLSRKEKKIWKEFQEFDKNI